MQPDWWKERGLPRGRDRGHLPDDRRRDAMGAGGECGGECGGGIEFGSVRAASGYAASGYAASGYESPGYQSPGCQWLDRGSFGHGSFAAASIWAQREFVDTVRVDLREGIEPSLCDAGSARSFRASRGWRASRSWPGQRCAIVVTGTVRAMCTLIAALASLLTTPTLFAFDPVRDGAPVVSAASVMMATPLGHAATVAERGEADLSDEARLARLAESLAQSSYDSLVAAAWQPGASAVLTISPGLAEEIDPATAVALLTRAQRPRPAAAWDALRLGRVRPAAPPFSPAGEGVRAEGGQILPQRDQAPPQREQAPPQRDQAPSQRDQAPSQRDQAPSQRGQAPSQRDQAPSQRDQAPSQRDQAPSQRDQAPSQRDQAPSQRDQAPSQRDQAPSQRDQAPSQRDQAPSQQARPTSGGFPLTDTDLERACVLLVREALLSRLGAEIRLPADAIRDLIAHASLPPTNPAADAALARKVAKLESVGRLSRSDRVEASRVIAEFEQMRELSATWKARHDAMLARISALSEGEEGRALVELARRVSAARTGWSVTEERAGSSAATTPRRGNDAVSRSVRRAIGEGSSGYALSEVLLSLEPVRTPRIDSIAVTGEGRLRVGRSVASVTQEAIDDWRRACGLVRSAIGWTGESIRPRPRLPRIRDAPFGIKPL